MEDAERRRAGGVWLRRQREQRGLTVRAMGREIGLDSSQVSNYENGKSAIDDRRAAQIASVFEIPLIEVRRQLGLWVPDGDPQPVSTLEAIEADQRLDEDGRRHFRAQYGLLVALAEARRRGYDPAAVDSGRPGRPHATDGILTPDQMDEAFRDFEEHHGREVANGTDAVQAFVEWAERRNS